MIKEKLLTVSDNIIFDEEMKNHTTFRIGGCADAFAEVSSVDEIKALIKICKDNDYPYMIVGNGSNLLVSDKGIRGLVIHIGKNMSDCTVCADKLKVMAGAMMGAVAKAAYENSLSGFEELSGIPGTIGGAIFMNAGAYGGEMKNVLESVTYLNADMEVCTKTPDELELGYRTSIFQKKPYVILSCVIKLSKGNKDEIKEKMSDYKNRRNTKQPVTIPSAGSTFKRPEGYFAGKLIQDAGLMGFRIGGASVSKLHAGFVVNDNNATAKDVMDLISHIQNTVYENFGVRLEPEVRLTGEE